MCAKARKETRYNIIGKVDSPELSAVSGGLVDISLHGCKIHYSLPVALDLESDYSLKARIAYNAINGELSLVCHPVWVREVNGNTDIGFTILRSPDTERLAEIVEALHEAQEKESLGFAQIVNPTCQFI